MVAIEPISARRAEPVSGRGAAEGQRPDVAARREPGPERLTPQQEQQVAELTKQDRAVRLHEQQHLAAAGQYARGGPSFQFQVGPDGKPYAVSGQVQIDTSAIPDNPSGTIRKMQQVRKAALAPADPSPQDQRVAAEASATEAEARAQENGDEAEQPGVRGRYVALYYKPEPDERPSSAVDVEV